jgi:predicted RNase H-like HicB family nuclease
MAYTKSKAILEILDMSEIIFLVEEADEGGFTARAVNESIFTEGDTMDDLRRNVREAVECHFDDGHAPKVIRLHIVREEILSA